MQDGIEMRKDRDIKTKSAENTAEKGKSGERQNAEGESEERIQS